MSTESPWLLQGTVAELRERELVGRIDVARPDRGLRKLQLGDRPIAGRLHAVCRLADEETADEKMRDDAAWPLTPKDSYVRAVDLVASYGESSEWPYSPQIYWNAGTLDAVRGVIASTSLVVSVQTQLLDSWPRIGACSKLACDEIIQVTAAGDRATEKRLEPNRDIAPTTGTCAVIRRLIGEKISYVEIMAEGDFCDVSLTTEAKSGKSWLHWTLFSEFMEKGVIRRARLVGAFLPRERDVELAVECCNAVENSPLPLTT